MPEVITSLQNEGVKHVVSLRDRKDRDKSGLTIVEGLKEICLAQKYGYTITKIYVSDDFLKNAESVLNPSNSVEMVPVSKSVYKKISYGQRESGALALCQVRVCTFEDLDQSGGVFLVIDQIEKPGNLGAMLRVCDGAGVKGVLVCDGRTDIFNPNVIRASIGAVFTNKIVVCTKEEAYAYLSSTQTKVSVLTPEADQDYTLGDYKGRVAIVVGSEQDGLASYWKDHASQLIKIPMESEMDSLNVAMSAGIMLYEIKRQRG